MRGSLVRLIVTVAISAVILAGLIVGDAMCALHSGEISSMLSPDKVDISTNTEQLEEALAAGDDIVRRMGEEGAVLMKNADNTLPLGATKENPVKANLSWATSTTRPADRAAGRR